MSGDEDSGQDLDEHRWVAHVLIVRSGHALLLRRRADRYLGGQWDIPGGSVEAGESTAGAAEREAWEEAGLRVQAVEEIAHYTNADTEGRPICFHTVTFRGVEQLRDGSGSQGVRLAPEEHDEYRWVPLARVSELDLVWHVHRTLVSREAP